MRGCEVRRLSDNTVLLRLSRSDQSANYDKLGGNAHAGLQWSADFNPSTAHLDVYDQRIAESRRWCELKSAAQIMRVTAVSAKQTLAKTWTSAKRRERTKAVPLLSFAISCPKQGYSAITRMK